MPSDLIHGLLSCRHQFSWPRRDDAGENYQVCVHCGVKYSYDWAKMRRIAPLDNQEDELDTSRTSLRKCGTRKAWIPRERRLRHQVSILFRVRGGDEWVEGVTENISRSGLLFRSSNLYEAGSILELIFEMPRELTGDDSAQVVCEGALLRVEQLPPTRKKMNSAFLLACAITQYKFLPSIEQPAPAE